MKCNLLQFFMTKMTLKFQKISFKGTYFERAAVATIRGNLLVGANFTETPGDWRNL